MGRNALIRTVFVAVLCLVSYLAIEMPWRFEVVDADLVRLQDHLSSKSDWDLSQAGISFETDSGDQIVCLRADGDNEISSFVRDIRLGVDVDHVRVSSDVKFEGIVPGPESWHQGNLFFWSFDIEGNFLWFWPNRIAARDEDSDWETYELLVPITETVKFARLVAFNAGRSGTMCIRELQVHGLHEKNVFALLRYGLGLGWCVIGIIAVFTIGRIRASHWLKVAFGATAFAVLAGIITPQPYYAVITSPIENALYSLNSKNGDIANLNNQAEAIAPVESPSGTGERTTPGFPPEPRAEDMVDGPAKTRGAEDWMALSLSFKALAHGSGFWLLAFLACITFRESRLGALMVFLMVAVVSSEAVQLFIVTRSSERLDLMIDAIGVVLGVGCGALARTRLSAVAR
jgi:hypothetical protein